MTFADYKALHDPVFERAVALARTVPERSK
jgi:hypothetical protein